MPSIDVETKEEHQIIDGKKLGQRRNKKIKVFLYLIDWMPQSAVALYIYRVGGLIPQEILLQDLNL